eukprot:CAMPEP_0194315214 /NCGR_PEP_ID=MMETSP0171-20130528/12010_1 /TAXON_ID=218684 /ORGANISM="Corethron pennatum, Strain L29A3" /LENGTH=524 /DNA_ID=CAMNT_0039070927 /DNA_START=103 /DNA_END=1673 /DNA_ORIENTATION=+
MASTIKCQFHFNRRPGNLIIVLALVCFSGIAISYFNSVLIHESNLEPAVRRIRIFPERIAKFLSWTHIVTNDKEIDGDSRTVVHYQGCSGLGHRLMKQSLAFHLTSALNISFLEMGWGTCSRIATDTDGNEMTVDVELSSHLFGSEPLHVPTSSWAGGPRFGNSTRRQGQRQGSGGAASTWFIANEVVGYDRNRVNTQQLDIVLDKVRSSVRMYRQLLLRFRFWEKIEEFFRTHKLVDHTVYGVHIRAGNGEQGDFTDKVRGIQGVQTEVWIQNVANLIREHFYGHSAGASQKMEGCKTSKKPPLVFVATDTPGTIDMLRTALQEDNGTHPSVPVISFPQKYAAEGVTYTYSFGDIEYDKRANANACLLGWEDQMIDMILLSMSDVMIAGMYSSFTQSMPVPLLLSSDGWGKHEDDECNENVEVCDVSIAGNAMRCYQTMEDWYFKRIAKVGDDIGGSRFVGNSSSSFKDPRIDSYPSEMKEEMISKIIDTLNEIDSKEKTMENITQRTYFCLHSFCPRFAPQG